MPPSCYSIPHHTLTPTYLDFFEAADVINFIVVTGCLVMPDMISIRSSAMAGVSIMVTLLAWSQLRTDFINPSSSVLRV